MSRVIPGASSGLEATAQAHPNIALIKYWGKRERTLNLPVTGSISLTLAPLATRTTVRFDSRLAEDRLEFNGSPADPRTLSQVTGVLNLLRARAHTDLRAQVSSHNDFPTAAGIASSASGYAALVGAAAGALELRLSRQELSVLARQGSGSACRSIHGGFVEWRRGELPNGSDSCAIPLAPARFWPLEVLVVVVASGPKPLSSREAMNHTVATSSFYPSWAARVEEDLVGARDAIFRRDFTQLGLLAEASCMAMFATMLGARPPVLYWHPTTVALFREVVRWREEGLAVFYTADAGPNVKLVCLPGHAEAVEKRAAVLPGVETVLRGEVGGPLVRLA